MDKKILFFGLILGFSISTGLAFFPGGHYPCEVYALCKPDILAENERLLKEAEKLKNEIAEINKENLKAVNNLKKSLSNHQKLNDSIKTSLKSMAKTIRKGMSNENKLRKVAKSINNIGDILINFSASSKPGNS